MAIQTAIDSINNSSGSPFGFKNRIINGAMVIDQRNAGASVTPAASTYLLDRWQCINTQGSKFSYQQSSTTASGFKNSMLATVVSAFSVGSGDFFLFTQQIEGFNIADLGWGAAGAATVTLSFWVRSSLTGTFGGYVTNGNNTRSYPFAYTISAANTFEYKTVTIAGDTTGTWNTGNTSGIQVGFSLGSGSSVNGTAGAWATATYLGATGQTNIVGTNGATFYITGVQLEKGSVATAFDYRPYGTELALCQRYYYRVSPDIFAPFGVGFNISTTQAYTNVPFPTVMRITPTAVEQNGTANNYRVRHTGGGTACSSVVSFANASPSNSFVIFTVASGLTTGQGSFGETNATGAYLAWSAEL